MENNPLPGGAIHPYILCLGISAAVGLGLFLLSARGKGISWRTVLLFAGLALPLGVVGAKLFYVLIRIAYVLPMYGVGAFFRGNINEYAFSGAVTGVLTALALTGRITKTPGKRLGDAFAGPGLVLVALSRFGEYFVDFGVGNYVENPAFMRFPFAVSNEYGEWFQAVFILEGVLALAAALFICLKTFPAPGDKGLAAIVLWALPQVFCESLRNECLRWGFVRAQQIYCVIVVARVLAHYSVALWRKSKKGRDVAIPWLAYSIGIGLCVAVEFALDKTTIPRAISYGVMVLALVLMAGAVFRQMWRAGKRDDQSPIPT